ncbi:hypothetical protein C4D60_Mb01t01440 [Musa balbisiana]|uniref:Uncharacterized protein n=1 Tax=Musa balbisiana TaxID=52838 RepID=A0A4S8JJU7_MUSBA|nr:hypothetical protein C4D60_Mb01t01440 [Musa balbisiana]
MPPGSTQAESSGPAGSPCAPVGRGGTGRNEPCRSAATSLGHRASSEPPRLAPGYLFPRA